MTSALNWRRPRLTSKTAGMIGGFALGVLFAASGFAAEGKASRKPSNEAQYVTGKVTGVEKKGKVATVAIEKDGGETMSLEITKKVDFAVVGPGSADLIRPNCMVSTEAIKGNNQTLMGKDFIIYVGLNPLARAEPDPKRENVYLICAQVISADQEAMVVNLGDLGPQKLAYEPDADITYTVHSGDPTLAAEGSEIEIEGAQKGSKFIASKVRVTVKEPLTAEVVYANEKGKTATKKGAASSKTTKSRAGKTKDDAGDGEGAETTDPFGVKEPGAKKPAKAVKSKKNAEGVEMEDPFGISGKKDAKKPKKAPAKPDTDE